MATDAGLVEPFRSNVRALIAEADRQGTRVVIVSGLRTRAQQIALRRANGCPDVMRSPSSACKVPTAIPGTSKHESGQAVDLGPPAAYPLIAQLAPRFALAATVPGEPWHYEAAGAGPAPAGTGGPDTPTGGGGGGLGAITHLFGLLTSGRFWLRVLSVLAGALLMAGGLALLGFDLSSVTS